MGSPIGRGNSLGYDPNIETYLEVGKKRTFAGVLDWPGWCRSGKTKEEALAALLEYGPRYEKVLNSASLGFKPPTDLKAFKVVEELDGDATTDFGAPGMAPKADGKPVSEQELKQLASVLKACWKALDAADKKARGKRLTTGPRGGGRAREDIVRHVLEAEGGYLSRLGWKVGEGKGDETTRTRTAVVDALTAAAHGEVEEEGPRGGKRWTARYFTRRVAWHALDHAWEIEDRVD